MRTRKIKKVLIALDYDPTAQKVAEEGYNLAKSMDAKVVLLHVVGDPTFYASRSFSPIMGYTGYMEMSQNQLDSAEALNIASGNYLNNTKQYLGDESIIAVVKEGTFPETILETATNMQADVIVMGSHSQKWLEKIIMGSVTEKVLQQTTIPLFIVPTKKQY